ncbi:hypothetical protein GHT06_004512 [Daphnia sinensis]|uniref:Uncharacterized protein n=1 Tax=Daphnia sinensis TaxID=1820382 RepID=A0AAD5KE32_9CRUS|nr:hypothetical protein GHT06_004512 [Daphnia sinensis]
MVFGAKLWGKTNGGKIGIATPATINPSFNVTLGEIRFIAQTTAYSISCTSDNDGDGIPNGLDLDSDNDGCSDAIEGDTDRDGVIDLIDLDDDNDGVLDLTENHVEVICSNLDSDNDGTPNHLDLDSDGDGCADAVEAGSDKTATSTSVFPVTNGTTTDTNSNGLLNQYEGTTRCLNACLDTDNDAVPNVLDLDDDNDGVLDAVECPSVRLNVNESGGTFGTAAAPRDLSNTTTTGIPMPQVYEGTTAGTIKYTSTYSDYAINNSINACLDTDQDGVADIIDIDDDNDGVLDITEQNACVTLGADLNKLSFTGSAITAKTENSISTKGGDVWASSYSTQNLKLPISLSFKVPSTTGYAMFGLMPAGNTQTPNDWVDGAYKFYTQNTTAYGYFGAAWDFNDPILPSDVLSIDISASGYVTVKKNGTVRKAFQGVVSDYKLAVSAYRASSFSDIMLTDATNPAKTVCADLDTDNDGIPNRLDLDSDKDGCADAIEASSSTTARGTTSYPTGTDTNGNGLLNNYESSTAGTISYTSTYYYALNNAISVCLDTDGDLKPDVFDIDDDNDGYSIPLSKIVLPRLQLPMVDLNCLQLLQVGLFVSSPDIADATGHVYGNWNVGCIGTAPLPPNAIIMDEFLLQYTGGI